MKKTVLGAVSTLAILVSASAAMAESGAQTSGAATMQKERTVQQNDTPIITKQDVKQGWENTKEAVSKAADKVSEKTSAMYEDVRSALSSDKNASHKVNMRHAASNILGASVYNTNNEAIAKVHDIILDDKGAASLIILSDGEIFGMGKKVAFDYNVIKGQTTDGDLIAPLSEDIITNAAEFSYDEKSAAKDIRVMPANGYSVAKLMEAKIINPEGRVLADVENIVFDNGTAKNVIVGFNKTLGMGGDKLALPLAETRLMKNADTGAYSFQLDATKSAQFEAMKNQF